MSDPRAERRGFHILVVENRCACCESGGDFAGAVEQLHLAQAAFQPFFSAPERLVNGLRG